MPFIEPWQLAIKEPLPGWQGRFFNSENMTFGHTIVAATGRAIVVDFPLRASIGGVEL